MELPNTSLTAKLTNYMLYQNHFRGDIEHFWEQFHFQHLYMPMTAFVYMHLQASQCFTIAKDIHILCAYIIITLKWYTINKTQAYITGYNISGYYNSTIIMADWLLLLLLYYIYSHKRGPCQGIAYSVSNVRWDEQERNWMKCLSACLR